MPSDETGLMESIQIGIDAESFIDSPLGKHLVAQAEREREEALQGLAQAIPTNTAMIIELQARVWRAESFSRWLAEAMQNGLYATQALRNQE